MIMYFFQNTKDMKLINIFEQLLNENILDTFIEKNVGDDKPISDDVFEEIKQVANGRVNYILWLAKSYMNKSLDPTDIYKFEEYIPIFENNKNRYPHKDINQYKTKADIDRFIDLTITIRDKDIDLSKSTEISDKYVSIKDIKRLEDVGIKYFGMFNQYQIFHIPNEAKDNEMAFNRYNEILGKCANRDVGEKIDICTFRAGNFKAYLKGHPGSSYFLLYNLADNKSPYQIHKETKQFKDKNNKDVRYDNYIELFHFIEDKMGYEEGTFLKEIYGLSPISEDLKNKYDSPIIDATIKNGILNGTWVEKMEEENEDMYDDEDMYEYDEEDDEYVLKYKDDIIPKSLVYNDAYNIDYDFNFEGIPGTTTVSTYINGVKNGLEIKYYPNGDVFSKVNYVNGKMDGVYYRDGAIYTSSKKITYKNGILDGPYESEHRPHKNYRYEMSLTFVNGKKEGIAKKFSSRGTLMAEYYYENDLLEGEVKEYEFGVVSRLRTYKNGILNGPIMAYDLGRLIWSGAYKNNKLEGEFIEYSLDGSVHDKRYYKNGKVID